MGTGQVILLVDDEERVRASVRGILEDEGYSVVEAADGDAALAKASEEKPDAVLLDIWMPGRDGLETLAALKAHEGDLPIVIMSGHGNIEMAVKAVKGGAFDFLEKPLSLDRLTLVLKNALAQRSLVEEVRALKTSRARPGGMVGGSPVMREILRQVAVVGPTQASVLITGENGTGKEVLARALHAGSKRAAGPFVEVNSAAIPQTLIESELFGHERGAFTGAVTRRKGKFDQADGGTIFLDEVGDMSLEAQAKILRVLEERTFERVGGSRRIEVDVRVLAATNKDLKAEIPAGRFREDLFFRLNVFHFHLPPLRERREDIPVLAARFLEEFGGAYGKSGLTLSPEAETALLAYAWPGNVRELRNLMERVAILATGPVIPVSLLPPGLLPGAGGEGTGAGYPGALSEGDFRKAREAFEREYFQAKLREFDGNVSRTAEAVGLERSNLHRKLKALGIKSGE